MRGQMRAIVTGVGLAIALMVATEGRSEHRISPQPARQIRTSQQHVDFVSWESGSGYSGYLHNVRIGADGTIRREDRQGIRAPVKITVGDVAKADLPLLLAAVIAFERHKAELASCAAIPDVDASVTVSIDGRSQTFVTTECLDAGKLRVETLRRIFSRVVSGATWSASPVLVQPSRRP